MFHFSCLIATFFSSSFMFVFCWTKRLSNIPMKTNGHLLFVFELHVSLLTSGADLLAINQEPTLSTLKFETRMVLKFAANLSYLFKESGNLLHRYAEAQKVGFQAVECAFPYEFSIAEVVEAKENANVEQVLINTYPGDTSSGNLGFAALSGRAAEFQESLNKSIEYCKALKCTRLHIMAGKCFSVITDTAMDEIYMENLSYAAGILEQEGIIGLIEPISQFAVPNYYLNSFEKALKIVKQINSRFIKLQVDIFHLQLLGGNLTARLQELLPYTGHIQIAQVPGRHEPNTLGEISYQYIFSLLEELKWDGYIGLEYNPAGDTKEGLDWISKMGYKI